MFSIVTAFFDIGRGSWVSYNRRNEEYLEYFKNLLSLRVNMIIFTEKKFETFVRRHRETISNTTNIIIQEFEELYMYKFKNQIEEIQSSHLYLHEHPNSSAPEVSKSSYNILVCSKMDFVRRATYIDTVSKYFIWLDAGYTHGSVDLSTIVWNPEKLFRRNKVVMISLQSLEAASDDNRAFFLQYIDVVIGGFFSGYRENIRNVCNLYYNIVEEIMGDGIIDDDQYYNTILAKKFPELIEVVIDNWYGALSF